MQIHQCSAAVSHTRARNEIFAVKGMIDALAHVHRNADGRIVSPSHAALNSTVLHAERRFSMRLSARGGPGSPEEAKLLQTPAILTVETSKCMALREHGWYATASVIRNVGILASRRCANAPSTWHERNRFGTSTYRHPDQAIPLPHRTTTRQCEHSASRQLLATISLSPESWAF